MTYETKNFDNILGLKGFSDQLLQNHFKLYAGYVTNTNKLIEELKRVEKAATPEQWRRPPPKSSVLTPILFFLHSLHAFLFGVS